VLQFESYVHVFDSILESEKKITEKIHTLVDNAFTLKDFTTLNFLQWYVSEQLEEENQFRTICDTIQMLVNNSESLYQLDKDLPAMRKLGKLE
jgi:ferritin